MHTPPLSFFAQLAQGSFIHPGTGHLCQRFLIATHVAPDGDAIGSVFAFAHILLQFGNKPLVYLPEGLPSDFDWLICPCPIITSLDELNDFCPDVLAFFDCGDARRAGAALAQAIEQRNLPSAVQHFPVTLNIDHHQGNPLFADHNWVEHHCSATGELVGRIAEEAGLVLQGDLGEAVYLALVSDTGRFTFPNTSPSTLGMAGRILEHGLDLSDFTRKREYSWSLARMHMWGYLLQHIQLHHNGTIVSCVVHQEVLQRFGTTKNDLEDVADMLKRLKGVAVVLFIREEINGTSKLSLRSVSGIDVRRIAALFGGGGHEAAAGANIAEVPEAVLQKVLDQLILHWTK